MGRGWPKGQKRGPWSTAQLAKQRAAHTKYPGAPFSRSKRGWWKKVATPWLYSRIPSFRAIVIAAKEKPCADCKQKFPPYVMDFDHVRGQKRFILSESGKTRKLSFDLLSAEISKCDVVCANCHRIRTHSRHLKGNVLPAPARSSGSRVAKPK